MVIAILDICFDHTIITNTVYILGDFTLKPWIMSRILEFRTLCLIPTGVSFVWSRFTQHWDGIRYEYV